MSLLVICDIDGTLTCGTERFERAGQAPALEDKAAYLAWVENVNTGMEKDKPVAGMIATLKALNPANATILYLTNREERHRLKTYNWLQKHNCPTGALVMRPNGTYSKTSDFKGPVIELARQIVGGGQVSVYDDDPDGAMEVLCKEKGWCFFKCRSGGQR